MVVYRCAFGVLFTFFFFHAQVVAVYSDVFSYHITLCRSDICTKTKIKLGVFENIYSSANDNPATLQICTLLSASILQQ